MKEPTAPTPPNTPNTDFYLVRTDSSGNRLWEGVINYVGESGTTGTIDTPSKMDYDNASQRLYIVGTSSFDRPDDDMEKTQISHLYLLNVEISTTGFTVRHDKIYRYYDDRKSSDVSYLPSFKAAKGADILKIGTDRLLVLGSNF